MTKEQRGKLLRERFRAKGGSVYEFKRTGKSKLVESPRMNGFSLKYLHWDVDTLKRMPGWAKVPNKPITKPLLSKQRHKTGLMAQVAIKSKNRKLVKTYQNAEDFLAVRGRK